MRLQRMLGHLTTLMPRARAQRAGHRLRRGRHRRRGEHRPGRRERDHRRDRAAGAARGVDVSSASTTYNVVDNPKVHVHIDDARHFLLTTEREVRRHHLRSARPVGQGRRDALHARVLRDGQAHLNPGGVVTRVRAAVREQRAGGEERTRHVLRGVSQRHHFRQHQQRRRLRSRAAGPGRAHGRSISTRWKPSSPTRDTRRSRSRCARSASTPASTCSRRTRGARPTCSEYLGDARGQSRPESPAAVPRRTRVNVYAQDPSTGTSSAIGATPPDCSPVRRSTAALVPPPGSKRVTRLEDSTGNHAPPGHLADTADILRADRRTRRVREARARGDGHPRTFGTRSSATPAAEVVLAEVDSRWPGMRSSSTTSRPSIASAGSISRTCLSGRSTAGRGSGRPCFDTWRGWHWNAAAPGSNGRCSTGIARRSTSTRASGHSHG